MLFLPCNVIANHFNMGWTDRECTVTVLPMKICQFKRFRFDPKGRRSFQFLDKICQRNRSPKPAKQMDMISDTADSQHGAISSIAYSAEIMVQFIANGMILQERTAFLGRKNDVQVDLG